MKEYRVQQVYDDDEFTEIYQISDAKRKQVLFSVGPKEGNLLAALKNKLQKEFLVYSGYLKKEIGVIRSNIGLSSTWTVIVDRDDIAKAEVKGIQYFNINVKDRKEKFSGKSTDISNFELKKGRDFSSCVEVVRKDTDGRLDMSVKLECKMEPEAILALAIAIDQKYLFEEEE